MSGIMRLSLYHILYISIKNGDRDGIERNLFVPSWVVVVPASLSSSPLSLGLGSPLRSGKMALPPWPWPWPWPLEGAEEQKLGLKQWNDDDDDDDVEDFLLSPYLFI